MCGLFGFSDPEHTLTQKQIRRLTTALATASEQRGTDASGIAYVQGQSLRIYKRPRPAHEMTWLVPLHTTAVMGHTNAGGWHIQPEQPSLPRRIRPDTLCTGT